MTSKINWQCFVPVSSRTGNHQDYCSQRAISSLEAVHILRIIKEIRLQNSLLGPWLSKQHCAASSLTSPRGCCGLGKGLLEALTGGPLGPCAGSHWTRLRDTTNSTRRRHQTTARFALAYRRYWVCLVEPLLEGANKGRWESFHPRSKCLESRLPERFGKQMARVHPTCT